jgi:hypothetical protein
MITIRFPWPLWTVEIQEREVSIPDLKDQAVQSAIAYLKAVIADHSA